MGLWPFLTSDLKPCDFYLCSILNTQVNSKSPCTEDDLRDSIQSTVLSVSVAERTSRCNEQYVCEM